MVVADNLLARAGLAALLRERGCDVLAQSSGSDLDAAVESAGADVLVIDLGWQTDALIDVLRALTADLPVVALLDGDESRESLQTLWSALLKFSGFAILPRDCEPDALLAALNALDHGLIVLDPSFDVLLPVVQSQPMAPTSTLTARENEVLQLLAQGLTNRAIALKLGITEHTVKFHVNAIMTKLHAQSRTEAVVRATQLGMIVL